MEPDEGPMACGEYGPGRLPDPQAIMAAIQAHFARGNTLAGRHVLVTAGPTHEPIDPVRYIANRSSGKQGFAIAGALAALGALTFGHVAKTPTHLLQKKFGIWGQQLWLFANGLWNEPLLLEVKDRTTISSNTTLPYDEPDYEAALTFALSEATRLVSQLRREQMQTREISLTIRFTDFSEAGSSYRFQHPQFQNSVINTTLESIFHDIMSGQTRPVRQIRIAMWNLTRLDTQPTLWGRTQAERWGALDEATKKLQEQLGKTTPLLTGAQLALQKLDGVHKNPKAKCPFVPQREMVKKLWGTDADPLAHKSEWEQRLGKVSKQLQFNH